MYRLIILSELILLFFSSCITDKDCTGDSYALAVGVDSSFNDRRKRSKERMNPYELYLFIQRGFEQDTIDIFINDKFYIQRICSTDPSMELCTGEIILDSLEDVSSVSFRMNCGPKVSVNLDRSLGNIITLDYREDTLKATLMKYPNIYE